MCSVVTVFSAERLNTFYLIEHTESLEGNCVCLGTTEIDFRVKHRYADVHMILCLCVYACLSAPKSDENSILIK